MPKPKYVTLDMPDGRRVVVPAPKEDENIKAEREEREARERAEQDREIAIKKAEQEKIQREQKKIEERAKQQQIIKEGQEATSELIERGTGGAIRETQELGSDIVGLGGKVFEPPPKEEPIDEDLSDLFDPGSEGDLSYLTRVDEADIMGAPEEEENMDEVLEVTEDDVMGGDIEDLVGGHEKEDISDLFAPMEEADTDDLVEVTEEDIIGDDDADMSDDILKKPDLEVKEGDVIGGGDANMDDDVLASPKQEETEDLFQVNNEVPKPRVTRKYKRTNKPYNPPPISMGGIR